MVLNMVLISNINCYLFERPHISGKLNPPVPSIPILGEGIKTWTSTAENGTTQSLEAQVEPSNLNTKPAETPYQNQPAECEDDDNDMFMCEHCKGGEWDSIERVLRCKGVCATITSLLHTYSNIAILTTN